MTPYYDDGTVTIYHGDCREVLPTLDLTDVDAVVADPPYGDTSLEWDRWPTGWPTIIDIVTTDAASLWCFGSFRMFMDQRDEFDGWTYAQELIWRKQNGTGFHADRFRRVHELVVQWYRGPWSDVYVAPVYTQDATRRQVRRKERPTHTGHIDAGSYVSEDGGPRLQRSVIEVRNCHGDALHPTQKPLGIIDPLLAYSVPPGGVVLDPFAGSGSTLRAARDRGLRSIGVEIDEAYCEIAAERCAQGVLDFGEAS